MWDCKYKVGKDGCRRRKARCYPGGKLCVLGPGFSFPLRDQPDELAHPKSAKKLKAERSVLKISQETKEYTQKRTTPIPVKKRSLIQKKRKT